MSNPSPVRKLGLLQVILLAIPCIAVLAVPFYNTLEPSLFGIPFFYWWQLIWVPVSGVFIAIVYKMVVPPGSGD
jgi:nitric oxide reductase large subunit